MGGQHGVRGPTGGGRQDEIEGPGVNGGGREGDGSMGVHGPVLPPPMHWRALECITCSIPNLYLADLLVGRNHNTVNPGTATSTV